MNILVLNQQKNQLQTLDIDIIKSVTGEFEASEIVNMFKDFFFNKMILDVTALKAYDIPDTYKTIVEGLNPDKVIFFLPERSNLCTSGFLSRLINYGIYNFTSNVNGIKFLVNKSNTLKDVENILKLAESQKTYETPQSIIQNNNKKNDAIKNSTFNPIELGNQPIVIGFENVTSNAGSTSLIYMLKKELATIYNNKVIALEIDKTDFLSYGDKQMISTTSNEAKNILNNLNTISIILVDLNNSSIKNLCTSVIYLVEPSTIKLNTLMRKNRTVISSLKDKKVILNKSLLSQKEVSEFEYESGIRILYNMPPLNDRKRNAVIADFLRILRLIGDENHGGNTSKIFGLFRK